MCIELRDSLLQMQQVDQEARKKGSSTVRIDRQHTAQLQQFVSIYGWPTVSLVGPEASHAAWLLVQHADHDVTFQKNCLGRIEKHVLDGEVQKEAYAFLYDRVCVNTNQPQLFGTQFTRDNENGTLIPREIRDIDSLDERRATYGLEPFEEYRRKMNQP